eukprot:gene28747-35662_t
MSQPSNVSLSYRDAGVDIDAGDALVEGGFLSVGFFLARGWAASYTLARC